MNGIGINFSDDYTKLYILKNRLKQEKPYHCINTLWYGSL